MYRLLIVQIKEVQPILLESITSESLRTSCRASQTWMAQILNQQIFVKPPYMTIISSSEIHSQGRFYHRSKCTS